MNNKTYDRIRYIIQIVLPSIATLYFSIGEIWGLPYVAEVSGTVTAIVAFGSVVLKNLSKVWWASDAPYDGEVLITDDNLMTLELYSAPEELSDKQSVLFKMPVKQ